MKPTLHIFAIHLMIWYASLTTSFVVLTANQYWIAIPILALIHQLTDQGEDGMKDDTKTHQRTISFIFTMVFGFISGAVVRNIPGIREYM